LRMHINTTIFRGGNLAGAEGFENEPLMLKDSLKSLISSVPYDLGLPRCKREKASLSGFIL